MGATLIRPGRPGGQVAARRPGPFVKANNPLRVSPGNQDSDSLADTTGGRGTSWAKDDESREV